VFNPRVYEINTRCWLRDLSEAAGAPVTLASVPESEFARWAQLGFTHVWLLGVWTTGPRSRAAFLEHPHTAGSLRDILPDWRPDDVPGSPYAVAEYRVPDALGGEEGLRQFRARLHRHGLRLLLDFVPNHVGLDHRWVHERPELFVQSRARLPETFAVKAAEGVRWIAHGRDPHFPPWNDTAQLDFRRSDAREAVLGELQAVARRCDGVRCDMAMLLLRDVFAATWKEFPATAPAPEAEFWAEAIARTRRADFLFVAEAYWDLEPRLQALGFDFTYDKRLTDYLLDRHWPTAEGRPVADLLRHVLRHDLPGFVQRSVHFLENHDEPRIAARLSREAHRAAALLVLGLPGMALVHEGQLTGAGVRVPVQLGRRPREAPDPTVRALYEELFTALRRTVVGHGLGAILPARPAGADNPTWQHLALVQWQGAGPGFDLVVVNLASHRAQCFAPVAVPGLAARDWRLTDLLGPERHERRGADLAGRGLYLDVPAHAAQLFHCEPAEAR
jgi:hypothetical protein